MALQITPPASPMFKNLQHRYICPFQIDNEELKGVEIVYKTNLVRKIGDALKQKYKKLFTHSIHYETSSKRKVFVSLELLTADNQEIKNCKTCFLRKNIPWRGFVDIDHTTKTTFPSLFALTEDGGNQVNFLENPVILVSFICSPASHNKDHSVNNLNFRITLEDPTNNKSYTGTVPLYFKPHSKSPKKRMRGEDKQVFSGYPNQTFSPSSCIQTQMTPTFDFHTNLYSFSHNVSIEDLNYLVLEIDNMRKELGLGSTNLRSVVTEIKARVMKTIEEEERLLEYQRHNQALEFQFMNGDILPDFNMDDSLAHKVGIDLQYRN